MSNTKHVKAKFCLLLALSSPLITLSLRIFPSFDKTLYPATPQNTSFSICDNQFFMGTSPIQIISGSIHYFRIHPDLWQDRLERAAAMGLNAIEVYVPWNVHEPYPGQFVFDAGFSDLERFLRLADSLHFIVLLRPGPYICAEWDFGGFPWWLGASAVSGGGTMNLRSLDADYMRHVERWWSHLFPRIKPLLHSQGGPVVMVQIENEYGFCGDDAEYIRQLLRVAKHHLGDDGVVYYTTDPPSVIDKGTLKGGEIYSAVDFGPGWFSLDDAFGKQASFNVQGRSPPLCTEFYSGWLTHWGESMANTSTSTLADYTRQILEFRNNTGSLSFYMIHGGTNFGFWAGANVDGMHYMPHITSYDYDAPISEAGDYGQPGIGGENKYFVLRKVIQDHMAKVGGRFFLPPVPPKPSIQGYGTITFNQSIPLLDVIQDVGMYSDVPHTMEEYGQMWGLILYRVLCSIDPSQSEHVLDVGSPPHDMAQIFVDGTFVGTIDRNERTTCVLPALNNTMVMQLDILVEAHGRQNGGCGLEGFDLKGLQSDNVTLNGRTLKNWTVYPLFAEEDLASIVSGYSGAYFLEQSLQMIRQRANNFTGPTLYKAEFHIDAPTSNAPHPACTYLALHGWRKGVAWVNGFNLGRYWEEIGPQMTLYVPGPVLKFGLNEIVLLELRGANPSSTALLEDHPDFYGPR